MKLRKPPSGQSGHSVLPVLAVTERKSIPVMATARYQDLCRVPSMITKKPDIQAVMERKGVVLKRRGRVLDLLMNKAEQLFFRLALRRREKRMGKDFDRVLSLEIDCLLTLIEWVQK
jgi:hypothetical protein